MTHTQHTHIIPWTTNKSLKDKFVNNNDFVFSNEEDLGLI